MAKPKSGKNISEKSPADAEEVLEISQDSVVEEIQAEEQPKKVSGSPLGKVRGKDLKIYSN